MTVIVCDICKKEIVGARKDLNYHTLLEKDLCVPCKDDMDLVLRQELRARSANGTVSFPEYKNFLAKTLNELCGS
jgi:hypothetical protein